MSRYAANASNAGSLSAVRRSQRRGVSVISACPLQILSDGPAFGGRAGRVVSDHAGGFPVAGQHDFRVRLSMTRNARAWRAGMVTTGAAVNPSEMAGRVNGSAVLRWSCPRPRRVDRVAVRIAGFGNTEKTSDRAAGLIPEGTFQTATGRNCALFAALCKLATRGSDEGLLTWARTLNSEFAVPLPESEVRGIWRSVCRYRARWRVQGASVGVAIPAGGARAALWRGASGWLAHRAATVGRPGRQPTHLVSAFPWG